MFKRLREKLKSWTTKVKEGEAEEVIEETPKKEEKKLPLKKKEQEEVQKKKKESPTKEKITEEPSEEIEMPTTFNVGQQKFEPDTEKLQEIIEEREEKKVEKKGFMQSLGSKISDTKISEEQFEKYAEDLEMILLENNVALEVVERILEELKKHVVDKSFKKKQLDEEIKNVLKEILRKILINPDDLLAEIKEKKPYIILFCGINGTGKTTTIAKIAEYLKKHNLRSVMAAGDTFRAASIEQLKHHGEVLNVPVIAQTYGADPASVGFDAIKYAEKHNIDVVLIDTAGRMHTAKNLIREIGKISRVCKPDKKIFVGESVTGNDSVDQVNGFDEELILDGVILTKSDIDEKGGTALSLGYVTGKPIFFLGTGQGYDDLEPFDKERFIEQLGL